MTERGLPSADGSPACPFVAFEDDRDARATSPDHRHRCFAEVEPAPRALAHQEAYCLSSAFPVCPTFQEWARREAAHAKASAPASMPIASEPGAPAHGEGADEWRSAGAPGTPGEPLPPRRNPPRDWAAPPPGAPGAAGAAAGAMGGEVDRGHDSLRLGSNEHHSNDAPRAHEAHAAEVDDAGDDARLDGGAGTRRPGEGAGLAGSAADRLAGGGSHRPPIDEPSAGPDAELAGLVLSSHAARDDAEAYPPATRTGRRPTVSSTRSHAVDRGRPAPEPEKVAGRGGPAWEHSRRLEAYPAIKTQREMPGMPGLSRVAVLAGALAVAALVLFFLPALIGVGGDDEPAPSPSPSAVVATPTPEPTPEPAPTAQVYLIKEGDTLSRVAKKFGLTLDQLLEANSETIKNPDRISVGDEVIIPAPPAEEVDGGASEEASPTP